MTTTHYRPHADPQGRVWYPYALQYRADGMTFAVTITVRTKAGLGYSFHPGYGKSASEAVDELVAQINAADQPASKSTT